MSQLPTILELLMILHDSNLFNFKQNIIGQTYKNDKKDVEIIVLLKYLRKVFFLKYLRIF